MKKIILYTLFLSLLTLRTQAQIRLIGVKNTNNPDKIEIVTWNMFDSSSVTQYQTDLTSYAFATSGFSDYSGQYHISGLGASGMGRLSFNTYNNNSTFAPGSILSNVTEFDMSTGIMYKLVIDTYNMVFVVANTMNTNKDSIVGSFVEPNLIGLLADAICFDANKGIIYHIGVNQNKSKDLYAMYVRDTNIISFIFTKTPIVSEESSVFSSIQFDNVNNKIYGLRGNFDSASNYLGSDIVEINSENGTVTVKKSINQFQNFVASTSCFDQNTSTFMIIGVDDNYGSKMIAYNTLTDSLVIGYVPSGVSELACINTRFAQVKYGAPSGVKKISRVEPISLYPNPAVDMLYINLPNNGLENNLQLELINMMGETVYKDKIDQVQTEFHISGLKPGIYFYKIMDKTQSIHTGKLSKE